MTATVEIALDSSPPAANALKLYQREVLRSARYPGSPASIKDIESSDAGNMHCLTGLLGQIAKVGIDARFLAYNVLAQMLVCRRFCGQLSMST